MIQLPIKELHQIVVEKFTQHSISANITLQM